MAVHGLLNGTADPLDTGNLKHREPRERRDTDDC